jgi:AraC-like DNA-binding protein
MTSKQVPVEVISNNISALTCLSEIIQVYQEYIVVAQEEQTKRRGIEAGEKVAIKQITAQRDVMLEYLERSFDERAENFRSLFKVLDQAVLDGNNTNLALTLQTITDIAKASAFKDLADLPTVRAALNDPNHTWEF